MSAYSRVASLITDGRFVPTTNNLSALRIGCTSTAQVLAQLDEDCPPLTLLVDLLDKHIQDEQTLHPAALLASLNSGFLLITCFPKSKELTDLDNKIASLALKLLHDKSKTPEGLITEPRLGVSLVACLILRAELADPRSRYFSQHNIRRRKDSLHQIAKRLSQWSQSPNHEKAFIWLGVSVISSNSGHFTPQSQLDELHELRHWAINSYKSTFECLPSNHLFNHAAVLEYLDTLEEMYTSVMLGTPIPHIYYFVIESMYRDQSSGYAIWRSGGNLLSKFCFPTLSTELVDWLANERGLIPLLRKCLEDKKKITIRFLAASQLWYLLAFCSGSDGEIQPEQARLEARLNQGPGKRLDRKELESGINGWWEKDKTEIEKWLGDYAYRILEVTGYPHPSTEQGAIEDRLRKFPPGLRGPNSSVQPITPSCVWSSEETRCNEAMVGTRYGYDPEIV